MKIKSIVKKEDLEFIIPSVKKLIIINTKTEQLKRWLYIILVTPLSVWFIFIALQGLFNSFLHIIIFFLNLLILSICLIYFLSLIFYPTYIKAVPIKDTEYEIELNDFYRNNIQIVVIAKDYIFIYFSPNTIKEKYFFIKNNNEIEFEQVKHFLIPKDGEKLKYKCIID